MKFSRSSRSSRYVPALIALFSMLFMQLAIAAYACPDLRAAQTGEAAVKSMPSAMQSADQDMPGCSEMDKAQPNLCHAHAQAADQSLDKPQLPQVQQFIPISLALASSLIDITYHPIVPPPQSALLTRITAPPLAIRHCCFRN